MTGSAATWAAGPRSPLISLTAAQFHVYGSAVWNHWLENGDNNFGPDVVLNAWESSRDVTPKDYAVGAYDDAIKDEGGRRLPAGVRARSPRRPRSGRTGDGNFPDASELPNINRMGKLKFDGDPAEQNLDNTSYALFKVNPKDEDEITLKGRSTTAACSGASLWSPVTDRRPNGTVERLVEYSEGDEKSNVTLPDAQTYDRITAVVTNADGHVTGSKPANGNFNYTRNGEDFKLKIR